MELIVMKIGENGKMEKSIVMTGDNWRTTLHSQTVGRQWVGRSVRRCHLVLNISSDGQNI